MLTPSFLLVSPAKVVKPEYKRDDVYCGSPVASPEYRGARSAARHAAGTRGD